MTKTIRNPQQELRFWRCSDPVIYSLFFVKTHVITPTPQMITCLYDPSTDRWHYKDMINEMHLKPCAVIMFLPINVCFLNSSCRSVNSHNVWMKITKHLFQQLLCSHYHTHVHKNAHTFDAPGTLVVMKQTRGEQAPPQSHWQSNHWGRSDNLKCTHTYTRLLTQKSPCPSLVWQSDAQWSSFLTLQKHSNRQTVKTSCKQQGLKHHYLFTGNQVSACNSHWIMFSTLTITLYKS